MCRDLPSWLNSIKITEKKKFFFFKVNLTIKQFLNVDYVQ